MCIFNIFCILCLQNRALLDTLRLQKSNTTWGHISLYTTLLIGHIKHSGQMRISSWPMTPKKLQQTNRHCRSQQDWVFIRPPGISEGAFQLRIDNIWFCKLLLLFTIETKTDAWMKKHACAYVSVLEEYKGHRRSGHILYILCICYICFKLGIRVRTLFQCCTAWLNACQSTSIPAQ